MIWLLLASVLFGIARFFIPINGVDTSDIYKDFAHIWVGFLFGAAIFSPSKNTEPSDYLDDAADAKLLLWTMAIGLTMVEVVAAIVRS